MGDDRLDRIIPVILSGGAGTRLWPLSRVQRPKQMLALAGAESMLRLTARRVAAPDLFRPAIVVAAAAQAEAIEQEVEALGQLILEPCARNTAPAIALAALNLAADDVMLVLPSDHLIADTAGFLAPLRRGLPLAREGWIVTFGMAPTRPDTGYGYIQRGQPLADALWQVDRFVEKPDAATAEAYLAEGGYDWNGGIFLMRAGRVIDGLAEHAPAILSAARDAVARQQRQGKQVVPDAAAFAQSPSISIDHALMEKTNRIAVAPVAIGWSDIGSWEALYDVSATDEAGNAVTGDVVAINSQGCLVRSDGPVVTAIGVDDLIIVATADAVLVVPRSQSQRVREIVDRLKADGRESLI